MSKESILQEKRECFFCGATANLHRHHCMFGIANRKKAEKYGLTVYLCEYHHTGTPYGVHQNIKMDMELKRISQRVFEKQHGHATWMEVFGKNYL